MNPLRRKPARRLDQARRKNTREPWLEFLRSKTTMATPQHYEEKTDVWVVGCPSGYVALGRALQNAETSTRTARFDLAARTSNSMNVVIVPAERTPRIARLRLWERVVCIQNRFQTELVIYGNVAAYRRLARILDGVSKMAPDTGHEHVDDWDDDWVIPRSVALNLRSPVAKWSKLMNELGIADCRENPSFFPSGMAYLRPDTCPYEMTTPTIARAYFPLMGKRIRQKL